MLQIFFFASELDCFTIQSLYFHSELGKLLYLVLIVIRSYTLLGRAQI
jgi:hypothetical protein